MKKKTYVYKLTSKYRKHPELLLNFGFQYYESDDKDVNIFAQPLKLSEDNPLFIQAVRFMEHIYAEATTEERETDLKGYEFRRELQPDQHDIDRLVLTDDLRKEFSSAQLCVSICKSAGDKTILFVNSPIENNYYHFETVKECAPELIEKLLKEKVIYARRHIYDTRG